MEVVKARSALLSNYEVLSLLRELESDFLARSKTAVRIKKEEEAAGGIGSTRPKVAGGKDPTVVEISENLRTIEVETIQYLSADYQPTSAQSPDGISKLVKALEPYGLTKAEKLQIVNLAPTNIIELYVIVEELEDRLGEHTEEVLARVRESLSAAAARGVREGGQVAGLAGAGTQGSSAAAWNDPFAEGGDANEMVFDDTGEGAGVEGDLDMEDD
ncbi:RNA polymerase Rpb4-domain-containing protein [Schizophyllum fasciatum]